MCLTEQLFLYFFKMSSSYSYSSVGIINTSEKACSGSSRCLARIPYGTLIATILCFVGVGVFLFTMWRGISLTLGMFDSLFKIKVEWLDKLQIIFVIIASVMGIVSIIILIIGFLATGNTRYRVYRDWKARIGGRIMCAVLMVLVYLLNIAWIAILCCMIALTVACTLMWLLCDNLNYFHSKRCIDLRQLDFIFPNTTLHEDLNLCKEAKVKQFCKDYVEQAEILYILSTSSCILIILSLVHYMICLAANYTHIKGNEKLQDLQELQYLQDTELGSMPKERF